MKAWVLHGINDIRYEEVQKPVLKRGEVLLKVMAAGICGSDIPRIFDTGAHKHPLIIGHEFSGVVVEIGADVDRVWEQRHVGVFPLIPCRQCEPCRNGQYEMCRHYDYLGSRCDGGFAEYVAVPVQNLIPLSEEISFEQAAMLEPMAVAVHAIRRGTDEFSMPKTAKIIVCGLGTIGLLVTMFLMEAGYRNLSVICNKEFQKQKALELGIEEKNILIHSAVDVQEYVEGVSLFFECVGKNETISHSVKSVAPAGKIVWVGNPHSDILFDRNIYWKILRDQITVMGTWNSSFTGKATDDWHYVTKRLGEKRIRPQEFITHRLSLQELDKGFLIMRDKTQDYCKIMTIMDQFL